MISAQVLDGDQMTQEELRPSLNGHFDSIRAFGGSIWIECEARGLGSFSFCLEIIDRLAGGRVIHRQSGRSIVPTRIRVLADELINSSFADQ